MNQKSTKNKSLLKDIQVISFDVGFTLIYTEPRVGAVYAKIAGRFGYHLNPEEVHSRFRKAWKTKSSLSQQEKIKALAKEEQAYLWWKGLFKEAIGAAADQGDLDDMFHVCFNEYARGKYWRLYPEVNSTLAALRSKGFRLVVLSNWDRRLLQTLKDLQLEDFFEKIYISTLIGYTKPDPKAFQYVVDDLNIPTQALLHIGDTLEEDIQGAQQANIRAVCIDRIGKNKAVPPHIPVISSLAELLI